MRLAAKSRGGKAENAAFVQLCIEVGLVIHSAHTFGTSIINYLSQRQMVLAKAVTIALLKLGVRCQRDFLKDDTSSSEGQQLAMTQPTRNRNCHCVTWLPLSKRSSNGVVDVPRFHHIYQHFRE